MCSCVCVRVYNCSLAVQPSAPGRILGWCGSVSNYLGILLLFRKRLHFMGLTPIYDCRRFIHLFIHLTHRYSVPLVCQAVCSPKELWANKAVHCLPIRSSRPQRGGRWVSRELYEVIEVGLGCHGSPRKFQRGGPWGQGPLLQTMTPEFGLVG